MSDPVVIAIVCGVFLLAGLVKGVIGMGLPTVALGGLAALFDLSLGMALVIAPSIVTNIAQAFSGGALWRLVGMLWPMLLCVCLGVALGAQLLLVVRLEYLSALLGLLLCAYGLAGLRGVQLTVRPEAHRVWGPGIGLVDGALTGMTGSFMVPGVMYLQAIGLSRDALVQAMGLLFLVSTLALGGALAQVAFLDGARALASSVAILPALAGMWLGRRLRTRMPEAVFRRVFFASAALLGLYLAVRGISGQT